MRILFASHHSSRVAGAETYVATAIPALTARGHVVGLLAELPASPSRPPIRGAADAWCVLPDGEQAAVGGVREWRPDVVYVNGVASTELERALMRIAPAVLFAHSYVGQCISGSRAWQRTGTPCTVPFGPGCLAKYFPKRCGGRSPLTMWSDYRLQRARQELHHQYAAIVVASWHMAATFAPDGAARRVHVLPMPVPKPAITSPRDRGTPIRMLYAGRLERLKGVQFLIDAALQACAHLKTAGELRILGDGPLRRELEVKAQHHGAELLKVRLEGWLDDQQRDARLSNTDLLLVPSVWPEPFGLIGLEAARFGVPAAAFASGGIPEWLRDGATGMLASDASARGLADAIVRCLGDPQVYRKLSEGALSTARALSPEGHAVALERVLKHVIQ